ncbi:unnamed protein product [Prorocentrum cordatum]|uniref:Uncharacterized protein n=1 Tax=Prorocentrum cordatum TaxID=2364126 RepID=A0ABN9S5C5_9DINO|nr:unnamed protein product [Polarella glacialis]
MLRCEQDPLCEAVVVAHQDRAAFTPCKLRMLVAPGSCSRNMAFDTWRMDTWRMNNAAVDTVRARRGVRGDEGPARRRGDGRTHRRVPGQPPAQGECCADVGAKADFLDVGHDWSGAVSLMGGENAKVIKCADAVGCPKAGITVRGDLVRCKPG